MTEALNSHQKLLVEYVKFHYVMNSCPDCTDSNTPIAKKIIFTSYIEFYCLLTLTI